MAALAGLVLLFSSQATAQYKGTAKVFIGPRSANPQSAGSALEELAFSREFVQSYAELLRSRPLAERTVERLQLEETPADLARRVRTRVVPDTRIIEVSVTATDPDRAALIANILTDTFVNEIQQEFGGRAGAQASVFEPAVRPDRQVSPRPVRDGVLAGMLGLMIGVGGALVLEQFDTRIRSREYLERAFPNLPVLTEVPDTGDSDTRELFVQKESKSPTAEAFRILRTNVQFLAVDHPISRVLVTSPFAQDGKTTVASNLACALAAAGFRTLLMESDLRRPTVHEYFGIGVSPGTSDVLLARRGVDEAIRGTHVRDLYVMTSGPLPPNPSELLGSQRMVDVLDEASSLVDVVVIDTPPTIPVTDAAVLAPRTDGVILVVRANRTHVERAREAIGQFERVGVRVLGIVLNGSIKEGSSYYYSRYYYEDRHPKTRDAQPSTPPSSQPRMTGEWSMATERTLEPQERSPSDTPGVGSGL